MFGQNDYRIVGLALSGMDLSNAFSLQGVSVYANMNLSLGTQIDSLKDASFDKDKNEVTLKFAKTDHRNYNIGGFLSLGGIYYKITDVKDEYIVVSIMPYMLSTVDAQKKETWQEAKIALTDTQIDTLSAVTQHGETEVKLEFTSKDSFKNYAKDSFLTLEGMFYKITDVQDNYIVVSVTPETKIPETIAKEKNEWQKATYIASANASLGFIGMDAFASGKVDLNAELKLEKSNDPDKNNFFGFEIASTVLNPTGEFELTAYADVFDKLNHSAINVFENYLTS